MAGSDSSTSMYVIANWDGTTWSQMGTAPCTSNMTFINYNGELLLGSGCATTKWDGINWISLSPSWPNGVNCFLQYGNDLYIGGYFDSIGSIPIRAVAKWNGSSWGGLGTFPHQSGFNTHVNSLSFFMGELYACGLFLDFSGNVMNIARWNGANWVDVGGGIHGGMDDAVELAVYNGELYVAGTFTKSHGNTGNYIQRWNGTNWNEVGGGVIGDFGGNGQIFDLEVYNNALYATGVFSSAGGIPAPQIAKWDGTNWCTLGNEISAASCLTKSNTDLYVGWFYKILVGAGDTTGSVIKWIGGNYTDSCGNTTGIEQFNNTNEILTIYPNPAISQIAIEFDLVKIKNDFIEIKNILGQTVKIINNIAFTKGSNKIEIDVREFPSGLYFVQLQSENKIVNKKFVKQ
ncbi:MAG: hypothetical protein A3F72_08945 [Bacteroidetes bacterium RIFCSPLOWO2_12_FULL_35_15]|nr:MAG: hypothetical protein A3F72_08945 [Bacteroidetes bacterium RIFCSPLOWO2_12_FULL_35_15]